MRYMVGVVALVLVVVACGGGDDPTGLDGRWDGGSDWGDVIINGLEGTYSDTFGADPGDIRLTKVSDTEYTGTWAEGTDRFGELRLELQSSGVVVGEWTADPDSAISGSSGGLLRWERS
jgi:hypothetical protein